MIKHFHELRKEEWAWLVAEGTTWAELERDFPQPGWCRYPNALRRGMGCWSLIAIGKPYRITEEADCQGCELKR